MCAYSGTVPMSLTIIVQRRIFPQPPFPKRFHLCNRFHPGVVYIPSKPQRWCRVAVDKQEERQIPCYLATDVCLSFQSV